MAVIQNQIICIYYDLWASYLWDKFDKYVQQKFGNGWKYKNVTKYYMKKKIIFDKSLKTNYFKKQCSSSSFLLI